MRLKQVSAWAGSGQEMKRTEVGFEGQKTDKTEEREETDVFQANRVLQGASHSRRNKGPDPFMIPVPGALSNPQGLCSLHPCASLSALI